MGLTGYGAAQSCSGGPVLVYTKNLVVFGYAKVLSAQVYVQVMCDII